MDGLLDAMIDARRIVRAALDDHFCHHQHVATVVLFSGGKDSTLLAHLFRGEATHFGHCNTTIGIEQTRDFVRSVAADWGVPLIEVQPDPSDRYDALVVEQGFPGPAVHFKMYQRLKERGLRKMRRQLVTNGRRQRVLYLSGVRRAESQRRSRRVVEVEREGSVVWAAPLANWTDQNMKDYREANPDLPHNEVTDHLHMSGECLCGAFAKPGELDMIRMFYPETAAHIDNLGKEARARGVPAERCEWGWGAYRQRPSAKTGRMCSDCQLTRPGLDEGAS